MTVKVSRADCNTSLTDASTVRVISPTIDPAQQVGQADEEWDDAWVPDPQDVPFDPDPEAVRARCLEAIEAWPIEAIGTRPGDWLAHDLLLHSLLRDARLSRFHAVLKAPEPWMLDRVAHLKAGLHKRGLQLAALHFLHLRQLDGVRDFALSSADWDHGIGMRQWQRLWTCPPYGALYEGHGVTNRCCGLVHLCPWCRARAGVRIWGRLQDRVGQRTLFLLHHFTTSHRLEMVRQRREEMEDPSFADLTGVSAWWLPPAFRPGHLYHNPDQGPLVYRYASPREVEDPYDPFAGRGLHRLFTSDPYSVLTEAQVRAARKEIHEHLDYWAERLGITGGLKVLTVEPAMHHDYRRQLESPQYRFAGYLLGDPPEGQGADPRLRRFLEEFGPVTEHREYQHLTAGKLRSRSTSLLVQALAWPPVMLFGPGQWPSYRAFTAGWPLYRAFGEWRPLLADEVPKQHDPFARLSPGRRALDRHNCRKAAVARAEHDRLLQLARPLWAKVLDRGTTGRRGRPASRQGLGQLLAGLGEPVTRRQLDALVADLKGQASA